MLLLSVLFACVEPETKTEYITETEEICAAIEGRQPCDFIVLDEDGNEVNFLSLIGKPMILDLSTMWCYPCNQAAVEVQATQDAYPEITYLTILIENREGNDPSAQDLKDWKGNYGITTAPVWAGSREVITDDPTESDEFYLRSWPTFYFLDKDLKIVGYQRGFDQTIVERWAEDLINSN